jgi:hypothetical protein
VSGNGDVLVASMLSGDNIELSDEHVGRRVIYTDRNKQQKLGTIRSVATGSGMIDVDLDNSTRARYYVPCDTITFVSDAAQKLID